MIIEFKVINEERKPVAVVKEATESEKALLGSSFSKYSVPKGFKSSVAEDVTLVLEDAFEDYKAHYNKELGDDEY